MPPAKKRAPSAGRARSEEQRRPKAEGAGEDYLTLVDKVWGRSEAPDLWAAVRKAGHHELARVMSTLYKAAIFDESAISRIEREQVMPAEVQKLARKVPPADIARQLFLQRAPELKAVVQRLKGPEHRAAMDLFESMYLAVSWSDAEGRRMLAVYFRSEGRRKVLDPKITKALRAFHPHVVKNMKSPPGVGIAEFRKALDKFNSVLSLNDEEFFSVIAKIYKNQESYYDALKGKYKEGYRSLVSGLKGLAFELYVQRHPTWVAIREAVKKSAEKSLAEWLNRGWALMESTDVWVNYGGSGYKQATDYILVAVRTLDDGTRIACAFAAAEDKAAKASSGIRQTGHRSYLETNASDRSVRAQREGGESGMGTRIKFSQDGPEYTLVVRPDGKATIRFVVNAEGATTPTKDVRSLAAAGLQANEVKMGISAEEMGWIADSLIRSMLKGLELDDF